MTFWAQMREAATLVSDAPDWRKAGINLNPSNFVTFSPACDSHAAGRCVVRGLNDVEHNYMNAVSQWSGRWDEPHSAVPMTIEQEELAARMVARGLVVFVRCGVESCEYRHPHVTALGKEALRIAELVKKGHTP